jgi:hypothetical protein
VGNLLLPVSHFNFFAYESPEIQYLSYFTVETGSFFQNVQVPTAFGEI